MRANCLAAVLAALVATVTWSQSASANVIFTVERLSDTTARITGTGNLDGSAPPTAYLMSLNGLFSSLSESNPDVLVSTTLTIGGIPVVFAYGADETTANAIGVPYFYFGQFGAYYAVGDVPAGVLEIAAPAGSFLAPVGSSDAVYWGSPSIDNNQGTWTMVRGVSVPEPGSLGLVAAGLAMFGFLRRRAAAS